MKYTKYLHKKKNEGAKFFTSLITIIFVAVITGLIGAWGILKVIPSIGNGDVITDEPVINTNNNIDANNQQVQEQKFAFIQCGYFSKEENANQVLQKIQGEFKSFVVKDDTGKFKVLVGIVNEDDASKIMGSLKAKGVENAKVNLVLNKNDKIQGQIAAITEGYLQIINTSNQDEVKEINTNDFKGWVKELEEVNDDENIEILNEYKAHIYALPEVINKESTVSELQYIYSILSRISN